MSNIQHFTEHLTKVSSSLSYLNQLLTAHHKKHVLTVAIFHYNSTHVNPAPQARTVTFSRINKLRVVWSSQGFNARIRLDSVSTADGAQLCPRSWPSTQQHVKPIDGLSTKLLRNTWRPAFKINQRQKVRTSLYYDDVTDKTTILRIREFDTNTIIYNFISRE